MKKTKSFSLLLLGLSSLSFLSGCGNSGEDIVIFYTADVRCAVDGARRVKNVAVLKNGEYVPIDPAAKCKVASISFILHDGGDGANMFQRCEVINPNVRLGSEVLAYYLVDVLHGNLKDKCQTAGERISIL